MTRYLAILAIWLFCYFAPMYAGEHWDNHFQLYNSLVSLFLMVAVLSLTNDWWRGEFATVCALHVLHNIGDFIFDFPPENYNTLQAALNWLEVLILVGGGGITQLYRMKYGRNPVGSRGDNSHDHTALRSPSGWRDA